MVDQLTFPKLRSYIESHLEQGEEPSSCWNLERYIFHLYKISLDPADQIDESFPNAIDLENLEQLKTQLQLRPGVYTFFYENSVEFHYFSCVVTKDASVDIVQTYGGINRLIRKHMPQQQWIDEFVSASLYHHALGLPKPNAKPEDLVMQTLRYRRLVGI